MKKKIVKICLIVLTVVVIAYGYNLYQTQSLKSKVATLVDESRAELVRLAETTGNAQVDAIAESVIPNCSDRSEYVTLLSDLENLAEPDLLRVKDLHGNCGHYSPTVRTFMAHRLEVALGEYESLVELYSSFSGVDIEPYQLEAWRSLVANEIARANLLRQQNGIQGHIITAIVNGEESDISDLLAEAQNVNGSLRVTTIQINDERAALITQ